MAGAGNVGVPGKGRCVGAGLVEAHVGVRGVARDAVDPDLLRFP